jgi:hypothetical protein
MGEPAISRSIVRLFWMEARRDASTNKNATRSLTHVRCPLWSREYTRRVTPRWALIYNASQSPRPYFFCTACHGSVIREEK